MIAGGAESGERGPQDFFPLRLFFFQQPLQTSRMAAITPATNGPPTGANRVENVYDAL